MQYKYKKSKICKLYIKSNISNVNLLYFDKNTIFITIYIDGCADSYWYNVQSPPAPSLVCASQ